MRVITLLLLMIFTALPAMAAGLQEKAKVRCSMQGKSFTGTITSFHLDLEPLLILNPAGEIVRIPLRDIRSIRATGKEQRLTLPGAFPQEEAFRQFEIRTLDGSRVIGAIDEDLIFSIYVDADGAEKAFDIEDLDLIEAQ